MTAHTRPRVHSVAKIAAIIVALCLIPATAAQAIPSYTISGTVTRASTDVSTSIEGVVAIARSTTGGDQVALVDATTGAYAISGLVDDTYLVFFQPSLAYGGDMTIKPEVFNDVYDASLATPIVVSGTDVSGIDAELSSTAHFSTAPAPTITHVSLQAGSTLGIRSGSWSPAPAAFTMRWYRSGVAIAGATKAQYVITTADRGKTITFRLTASKPGYAPVTRTSAGVYIPKLFTKTVAPKVTGSARSGYTLTAHRGTWSPTPTYSYQWLRNGVKITGATSYKYKLTSKDKGKKIQVRVYAKKSGYLTSYRTSASKTIAR